MRLREIEREREREREEEEKKEKTERWSRVASITTTLHCKGLEGGRRRELLDWTESR
jgi:hypothetical protein